METKHKFIREPQPMADQWMAICSCGWRKPVSYYQFDTHAELFAEMDRLFAKHIDDDGNPV